MSQKNLKTFQDNIDQTQKDIEVKRLEIVASKKEIEADKKRAEESLVTLKKEIEAERKTAEEKQKEVKELLRKIEENLKGAVVNLKNKNPEVRLRTAKGLAKLPIIPELKEIVGEALVEAMMDPVPIVRNAAAEAVDKIDPAIHPHIMTLIIGEDKRGAWVGLEKLGKEARFALPILFASYRNPSLPQFIEVDYVRAEWLVSLAKIAPNDTRVVQIMLQEVVRAPAAPGFDSLQRQRQAISLLDKIGGDKKAKIKVLVTALNSPSLALVAIDAIEKMGLPESLEAIPALKAMKLSSDDAVRNAATKALTKIEASK